MHIDRYFIEYRKPDTEVSQMDACWEINLSTSLTD